MENKSEKVVLKRILIKNSLGQIIDFGYTGDSQVKPDAKVLYYSYEPEMVHLKCLMIGLNETLIIYEPTDIEWNNVFKKNSQYLHQQEAELKYGKTVFDAAVDIAIEYLNRLNNPNDGGLSKTVQSDKEPIQPKVQSRGKGQTIRANE